MRKLMLAFRAFFLLSILYFAIIGEWSVVLAHAIVFIGSLFVPWLGRRNEQYYALDAGICAVFLAALLTTYFNAWPDYHTIFSFDKVFHMAAGALLAGFAAIYSRKQVTDRMTFYIGIIAFALAVGGAWEVFEWLISLLPQPLMVPNTGLADSMMDMIADTAGAVLVASVLAFRRYL